MARLCLIVLALSLSACRRDFVSSLNNAVARSCGRSSSCQFDLQEITRFDWDYLVDCNDGASLSQISAAVGHAVPPPQEGTRRDIFVKSGKVIRYDQHSEDVERANYGEVYFDHGTGTNCIEIKRSDSRVNVRWTMAGEGENYYVAMIRSDGGSKKPEGPAGRIQ